ncbi:hypothetical protein DDT10_06925 [Bacillus amyloliquefaciens]|nr:hypothetical protein BZ167_02630 [Bacillus sp. 275]AWD89902.1 hypothetical protein BVQ_07195 [Bacillus velezensis]AWM53808.1 hypothetical protein DDT10_06925 [Bacillus amyloliquefaciens]QBQ43534.1 hypothetical protein E3U39_01995 [Bacillus amyloliquefaciens]RUO84605.1 hypothetical protein EI180_02525 [Bacillus velezensis]
MLMRQVARKDEQIVLPRRKQIHLSPLSKNIERKKGPEYTLHQERSKHFISFLTILVKNNQISQISLIML